MINPDKSLHEQIPPCPDEWQHKIGAWQLGWVDACSGKVRKYGGYTTATSRMAYAAGVAAFKPE